MKFRTSEARKSPLKSIKETRANAHTMGRSVAGGAPGVVLGAMVEGPVL